MKKRRQASNHERILVLLHQKGMMLVRQISKSVYTRWEIAYGCLQFLKNLCLVEERPGQDNIQDGAVVSVENKKPEMIWLKRPAYVQPMKKGDQLLSSRPRKMIKRIGMPDRREHFNTSYCIDAQVSVPSKLLKVLSNIHFIELGVATMLMVPFRITASQFRVRFRQENFNNSKKI